MNDDNETTIAVRLIRTDITAHCNNVPSGARVIEKGLAIDGVATFCCSLTSSAWVEIVRYDLEPVDSAEYDRAWSEDRAELWNAYELALAAECEGGYYMDYHAAMQAPLDWDSHHDRAAAYDSLEEARDEHNCNYCF
jgi:hypothetical protein